MNRKKIIAVVARTHLTGAIGKQGILPWYSKTVLGFFRAVTSKTTHPNNRNAVIMGRKTWDNIPTMYRPLINRLNIVLSHELQEAPGAWVRRDFLSTLDELNDNEFIEKIFIIGGGEIFEMALPYVDEVYETIVYDEYDGCDTFFPKLLDKEFHPPQEVFFVHDEPESIHYKFTKRIRHDRF